MTAAKSQVYGIFGITCPITTTVHAWKNERLAGGWSKEFVT
jgi:hypothetical protein